MESVEFSTLREDIKSLNSTIQMVLKEISLELPDAYSSDDISQVATALSKAQVEYRPLGVDKKGSDGKYASLKLILACVQQALSKNELAFYQYTQILDQGTGGILLQTRLLHSSGQWVGSKVRLLFSGVDKDNGRTLRFNQIEQAKAVLGIHADDEFEDNGDIQAERELLGIIKDPLKKVSVEHTSWEKITKEQYELIAKELKGLPEVAKDIYAQYSITSLKDMPKDKFSDDYARVTRIKYDLVNSGR